jgi:4-diphosphocytidyl-2-C-methyl-D-erythritol kinase
MKLFSPAKVNLTLAVMAPREDGFHALDSLVTPLTLGDDLFLEPAEAVSLQMESETVDLSEIPADIEKNLAVRAVRILEAYCQRSLPTAIRIVKRIPLGGGLGGGSSNAATVLRGMNTLWKLQLSDEILCQLGAKLGSDVPLFVLDGTVRMRGRGEIVERIALPNAKPLTLLLVNDGTH